jgi:hypothetical protein
LYTDRNLDVHIYRSYLIFGIGSFALALVAGSYLFAYLPATQQVAMGALLGTIAAGAFGSYSIRFYTIRTRPYTVARLALISVYIASLLYAVYIAKGIITVLSVEADGHNSYVFFNTTLVVFLNGVSTICASVYLYYKYHVIHSATTE